MGFSKNRDGDVAPTRTVLAGEPACGSDLPVAMPAAIPLCSGVRHNPPMIATLRPLLLALLLAGPAHAERAAPTTLPIVTIEVDGIPLTVEVADEEHERQRGLMQRTDLPDGHGMLFIYPQPGFRAFWMRDTPLHLDLAYIDGDGMIFQVVALEPLSLAAVPSRRPARYVLEVPLGWFAAQGIGVGSRLFLDDSNR